MGLIWASNLEFAGKLAGTPPPPGTLPGPTPADQAVFFTPGATGTVQLFVGPSFDPQKFGNPNECTNTTAAGKLILDLPGGPVASGGHGFLLSFEHLDLTAAAQGSIVSFLNDQPVLRVVRAQ
jgi:hypothetical protein